ncbi:hypothetical protein NA57DRAFT_36994 [Rhizodiscina lignyota]|uniref:Mitochondrial distribution and morphology protein 12 n=1 Tax=Rhizodiscina lignyota TaxID=1504668 RepID=A0A9P4IH32_9PEZI|nr:hypothetical protein NA57DRAFT_36994 [Rhizodiscina lignyota]
MSIDIDWNAVTGGSDGLALAEAIRTFIHDKFQEVPLPRFIRAVKVHGFEFGSVAPKVEIKDICDPLDDFYEDDGIDDDDDDDEQGSRQSHPLPPHIDTRIPGLRTTSTPGDHLGSPSGLRSSTPTPGIPGGTSSLSYFHLPLGAGLSGTTTPLAAVAGRRFHSGWPEDGNAAVFHSPAESDSTLPAAPSISSMTPPSTADPCSRPTSQHYEEGSAMPTSHASVSSIAEGQQTAEDFDGLPSQQEHLPRFRERSPQDVQVVTHVKYAGDVKMSLTAEILLDYPTENFVGIPLKLNITGLSFDGVAIFAYIRRRAHFCFLSPEDAHTLVGAAGDDDPERTRSDNPELDLQSSPNGVADQRATQQSRNPIGGLLEHIRVESEIGDRANGKQVLKNVGKVEKFVLDQVRRIFEDEFVYPSFWTFLV